jgi:Holliday junction resolvase
MPDAGRTGGKKMKESEIQAQIRDYLRWTGWFVVKIHQSLGSYRGIADLYALRDGQHVWIEVKTDRGVQSEYQKKFQRDIEKHGGTYILARGIEDVEHLGGKKQLQLGRR